MTDSIPEPTNDEATLAASLEERAERTFGQSAGGELKGLRQDQLSEMEKRLPSWSLEPPTSFGR